MADIKQLPSSTSRLLCSGQIITSIFSVVKELVENSLDSGCTSIDVKLENYGLDKIEVRDNGCGIHRNDIPDMVKPHYTSKISSFADLETLQTYGFRGEAIGALCAVADVSICSKTSEEDISWTYIFGNNGQVRTSKPSASPQGTTVIAADLFKKIPVRRQIYKSEKTRKEEIKKIESLLCSFACSELGVRFALHHNRSIIWQKSAVNDLRSAMIQVYGSLAVNNMVPIYNQDEALEVKLEGFFPKPNTSVSTMSQHSSDRTIVVVNKRPVRIKELEKVLVEGYLHSADFSGNRSRFPLCFLSISLPPSKVDVNIEPNKTRVLLHCLEEIKSLISASLEKLYHTVLPSKQATESSAITDKLNKDTIFIENELCFENASLLSSDKSSRESCSSVFNPKFEPVNNSKQDMFLKTSSHIRSDIQSNSAKQDDVLQNIGNLLKKNSNHDINTPSCNSGKESCLLSEGIVDSQKNTSSKQTASEIHSDLVSRCSSIIDNSCLPRFESSKKNFENVIEILSSTGHLVQNNSTFKDNILENADLSDSFKHTATKQISNNAESLFLLENVSGIPKGTGIQQTVSKSSISTENSCDNQMLSLLKNSLVDDVQTIMQPRTVKPHCSLYDVPQVNVSTNLPSSIGNSHPSNANPNDRVPRNFQNNCALSATQDAVNFSDPFFLKVKSPVANKTAIKSLNMLKSIRSGSSCVKQDQSDTQSDFILLKNFENAQTFVTPSEGEPSSSNNGISTKKCLHLPSEHVNINQTINLSSERIQKEHKNDTVLLKPAACESLVCKPVTKSVNSDTNKLHTISIIVEGTEKPPISTLKDANSELHSVESSAQKTINWSMGNLLNSGGKKLEPVTVLTKSPVKRIVEEDFVCDAKRKKIDFKDKQSEVQGKQPVKNTLNAFGVFCRDFRLEVALLNPGCTNQDVAKILTEKWNNLPPETRVIYENKATESGVSKRKIKKKLGTTLSQTLNTLKKPNQKSSSKKIRDEDQERIRKRKVTVIQFSMEDLKAKRTQNSLQHCEEIKNEEYSLINSLSPGSWICLRGAELLLLNSFRLREMLIYRRLMDTYVFPSEKLSSPVALNESMIGGDELWQVLFELVRYSDLLSGTCVADKRVTSNGFKIRIEEDSHSATLTEMPSCLPFCGVSDLTEILRHLKRGKGSAKLCDCRPSKAIHYLQGEAVRIVRQSPGKLRKDEIENLLKQRKAILPESSSVCIHNKPFFHLLYNIKSLQSEEVDLQDF